MTEEEKTKLSLDSIRVLSRKAIVRQRLMNEKLHRLLHDEEDDTDSSFSSFLSSLHEYPVFDGKSHCMEDTLRLHITGTFSSHFLKSATLLFWEELPSDVNIHVAADFLRLMGRMEGIESWHKRLAVPALKSEYPAVREAAIEAIENWGNHELLSVLMLHKWDEKDPRVLSYLNEVILDFVNSGA